MQNKRLKIHKVMYSHIFFVEFDLSMKGSFIIHQNSQTFHIVTDYYSTISEGLDTSHMTSSGDFKLDLTKGRNSSVIWWLKL